MYAKLFLCATIVLALYVLNVQSTEHGGGGSGPIIINSRSGKRGRNNDLIMLGGQTKCGSGPTLIKTSGRKRRQGDLIFMGGSNNCGKKKTEMVPVPYPVKEMVPVPYKETVHVPVHIPVHIPVPMKEEYGGGYGGGMDMGGYGGGMDMGGGYSGGYRR